jgi:hypothetical protein
MDGARLEDGNVALAVIPLRSTKASWSTATRHARDERFALAWRLAGACEDSQLRLWCSLPYYRDR